MANKRAFWVLSKQPKEISGFGKNKVPTSFKTVEEAKRYCKELNLKKGAYHPGYFIEERIGNQPVTAPSKKAEDVADEG
jgi:viroplasmin and RNaseH domain-containing protein